MNSSLRHIILLSLALLSTTLHAQKKYDFFLTGRVKESVGKTDLLKAMVILNDSVGNPTDTVRMSGLRYKNGEVIETSLFSFPASRKDSTYVFDVVCEGYEPYTVVYDVRNVGKRERGREIPTVYMKRAPRQLKEVTVTASKIKFYNKGDTIVFNADAFQLAEGSMLDALIAQLPGVQLDDAGQIKVNGQFVESLLLNGKEFLDGDNQLMLENIAAYTVKNVEVYKGQTKQEKWLGDESKQHLTMDVKLKKEYNQGWLINAQGGYGTKDRYMGRLFASWFSPTTSVTLLGNVNNLNDNRQPGKNDNWTPEMMPSGTREYRMGGLNYDYESPESDRRANGKITFQQTLNRNHTTTSRTNFLSGGDTYENSFSRDHNRDTKLETTHDLTLEKKQYYAGIYLKGRYRDRKNSSSAISGTFDTEQQAMTMEALEALYSAPDPAVLDAVINRSITKSDGSRRELTGQAFPRIGWKIPRTSDRLTFEAGFMYTDNKEERWRDYNINYGADPTPAYRRRQYFDDTPNYTFSHTDNLTYHTRLGKVNFMVNYEYRFSDKTRDSYMYALDRLADMGVYGTLPAAYLDTFDPANSYTSRTLENTHSLSPQIFFRHYLPEKKGLLWLNMAPTLSLKHSHLDYWRDGKSYLVKQTDFLVKTTRWQMEADLKLGKSGEGDKVRYRHDLEYSLVVTPTTPNPVDMVDVVNDADPLNIRSGNPDLKVQYEMSHILRWTLRPEKTKLNNCVGLTYSKTFNALTSGYTYDTSTGVRHSRMYNVGGNSNYGIENELRYQFGTRDQFTLSSVTAVNRYNYGDMIGVNLETPELSKVATFEAGEKLALSWQIGNQSLQLRCGYANRRTTSTRQDFSTIDATHVNVGLIGQFRLPAGFSISTDINLYTRRGYGMKELDTTDAIWNLRLSWCPPKFKKLVFMIDGFDMLQQLSNVNYAVTASGRTVSYSNALPRYVLFSVQYRLNIQPKKK